MKYTPPKFEKLSEMSSIDVARLTEDEARNILEGIRWGKGRCEVKCSKCGKDLLVTMEDNEDRIKEIK